VCGILTEETSTSLDKESIGEVSRNREFNLSLGSIVELRSRLWRVDDVQGDVLVATSIEGTLVEHRRFYIPLEKIRPGRIEPPSGKIVGNYATQDLLLRAYRLSMIHGTAPLLSLQRSRAVPVLFQMVPVVMSLEMPRVRMLIADDVGLGKTIEAGLIVVELFARQRASRLLVVCPAMLREQWKTALDYFFHLNARIISSRHRREMERELPPGTNPWEYYPYLITSMDYAKTAEVKPQILEQTWDIVLVDEAHNVAKPHQADPRQRVEMERWELMRELSKKSRHLLMLTATPHNGYTDTYASLLRMLDVGAVSGPDHDPVISREVAKSYVCQRRRKDVEEELKKSGEPNPFPKRTAKEVFVKLSDLEVSIMEEVEQLGKHILASAGMEHSFKMRIAKWTVTHFHKRALSSPYALVCSLKNRLNTISRKLERQETPPYDEDVSVDEHEARSEVLDNDTGERVDDEETGARMERFLLGDRDNLQTEKELLLRALLKAQKVTAAKDSKLNEMLDNPLREMFRANPKVIIFTRYKDTLDYLARNIPTHRNFKNVEIVTLDGSLNESQRAQKFHEFKIATNAIMIATDCISEGINLQYVASQIIHYELPWNPNRLEQRNGRIDRYGQPKKEVFIKTMVVNDSLEAAILVVLVEKALRIRQEFGFSPPFFGDDLSVLDLIREQGLKVRIGQRNLDEFLEDISSEEEVLDPFSDESIQRMKNDNFYGQSSIDLSLVQKRLTETWDLIGSQNEVQNFVKSGLNKFGCRMTDNADSTFRIEILDSRLAQGLDEDTIPRATFDPLRGKDDSELDVIDLGHRLVRNLIELVKELTFSSKETYGRTACIATKSATKVTAVYTFLARYAVYTKPVSIVEELLKIGLEIHEDRKLAQHEVDALSHSTPTAQSRTGQEMCEDLTIALSKPHLEEEMRKKAEERCTELAVERQKVKKSLEDRGEKEWLEGIDKLSVASVDLLCVTVYYPMSEGE